ncbi:MAG: OadG family protein [Porticoccaceae bacterium]|jgi:oxaloacetate decarboxylase gamma subunit|nr:OadG family protein [Porticoccaceae bacterium]
MEATLIDQGLDLMLFGMGTVFTFLTLLVGVTHVMSVVVNKIAPAEPDASAGAVSFNTSEAPIDPRIAKVIQVAIDKHRAR